MCIYRVYPFMDCKGSPQDSSHGHHSLTTESRNTNFKPVIFHTWFLFVRRLNRRSLPADFLKKWCHRSGYTEEKLCKFWIVKQILSAVSTPDLTGFDQIDTWTVL